MEKQEKAEIKSIIKEALKELIIDNPQHDLDHQWIRDKREEEDDNKDFHKRVKLSLLTVVFGCMLTMGALVGAFIYKAVIHVFNEDTVKLIEDTMK